MTENKNLMHLQRVHDKHTSVQIKHSVGEFAFHQIQGNSKVLATWEIIRGFSLKNELQKMSCTECLRWEIRAQPSFNEEDSFSNDFRPNHCLLCFQIRT